MRNGIWAPDALIPQEGRNPGNYHVAQKRPQIDAQYDPEFRSKEKPVKESQQEDSLLPKLQYERKLLVPKRPEKCTIRRDNIFFLKIHKAGAATVQNILLR